jgi:hypothetical protein
MLGYHLCKKEGGNFERLNDHEVRSAHAAAVGTAL